MRVTDQVRGDFLVRLRYGRVQRGDLTTLSNLLPQNFPIDCSASSWTDTSLITPCHTVRTHWNQASLRNAYSETCQRLFVCLVEDTIKYRPLSLGERYSPIGRSTRDGRRKRKDLPEDIKLAIGILCSPGRGSL